MSENSEKSLHAISILKEAHQLCQDGKFDEAVQKCEAAMQVYQDDDNQVGILCCYVNISNVHRSKAARYFKELMSQSGGWKKIYKLEDFQRDVFLRYLGCLGGIEWFASPGPGNPSGLFDDEKMNA